MALATLTTLMHMTVTVGADNRPTPADRIGQGNVGLATYPADVPSRHSAHGPTLVPVGGRLHGPTACRRLPEPAAPASAWAGRDWPATPTGKPVGGKFGASFPVSSGVEPPVGSDCQSPDRSDTAVTPSRLRLRAVDAREVAPASAAG